MANGLSTIVTLKNDKRNILRKGKAWKFNMNLANDFYMDRVVGDDLTELITDLKGYNKVYITETESYTSDRGHVIINDMYGTHGLRTYCCFIINNKSEVKLMTIPSKMPSEFAAIGHNAQNQCIVPVIITKQDDKYIGINIT